MLTSPRVAAAFNLQNEPAALACDTYAAGPSRRLLFGRTQIDRGGGSLRHGRCPLAADARFARRVQSQLGPSRLHVQPRLVRHDSQCRRWRRTLRHRALGHDGLDRHGLCGTHRRSRSTRPVGGNAGLLRHRIWPYASAQPLSRPRSLDQRPLFDLPSRAPGVRGGQIIGRSDKDGGYVADQPHTPEDYAATVYEKLGIDRQRPLYTANRRPIYLRPQRKAKRFAICFRFAACKAIMAARHFRALGHRNQQHGPSQ